MSQKIRRSHCISALHANYASEPSSYVLPLSCVFSAHSRLMTAETGHSVTYESSHASQCTAFEPHVTFLILLMYSVLNAHGTLNSKVLSIMEDFKTRKSHYLSFHCFNTEALHLHGLTGLLTFKPVLIPISASEGVVITLEPTASLPYGCMCTSLSTPRHIRT